MSAITAVANHLNIAESLISEIQEWASVLWVRFVSGRPRFVSKKVVVMYKNATHEAFCKMTGNYVDELPEVEYKQAPSPFLPQEAYYKGTNLTPDMVLRESAKYCKKYTVPVSPGAVAYDAAKHGNIFGYLG